MLKLGIIGIGNAGNQIADLATRHGIKGIALNSSEKDVSTLTDVEWIIVGDEKGAGKDRNIAKGFIQKSAKKLLEEPNFVEVIDESEIIYVISSTGGGTGSGMAPVMYDVLKRIYPKKHFILTGILPPLKESVAAQQNTIEYLKEMRKSNPVYQLYDNNTYASKPSNEMLSTINQEIVDDMLVIRGDYQFSTPYNSIDEKDMQKIIETPGRLALAGVTGLKEKDLDEQGIEERLIHSIKTNSQTELDRDQIIKRLGVIVNLNDKMYRTLDGNLPNLKEFVGEPIEGFEHISINDEYNKVFIIMSGLSVPDDRIEKIVQRIAEVQTALTKVKESSILDDASTDQLSDLRQIDKGETDKEVDLDDVFGSYMNK